MSNGRENLTTHDQGLGVDQVLIQNSVKGCFGNFILSLSHSKAQQIPLELQMTGNQSHLNQ